VDGAGAEIDGDLRFHRGPGLDAQGPEHRLERVGGTTVGMPEHASYGAGARATYVDRVEVGTRHQP